MSKEPFVYEGRIRVFDPEPGDVIYLQDHPDADEYGGPDLVSALEKWRDEGTMFLEVPGRFRITIEEVDPAQATEEKLEALVAAGERLGQVEEIANAEFSRIVQEVEGSE